MVKSIFAGEDCGKEGGLTYPNCQEIGDKSIIHRKSALSNQNEDKEMGRQGVGENGIK